MNPGLTSGVPGQEQDPSARAGLQKDLHDSKLSFEPAGVKGQPLLGVWGQRTGPTPGDREQGM